MTMPSEAPYPTSGRLLMAPALAFWSLFLLVPVAIVLYYSLHVAGELSFANYVRAFDPIYGRILLRSAYLASLTTVVSLVIAYPAAWAVRSLAPRWQLPVLGLIAIPSWLNLLVKNYAWIVLLRREGVINSVLQGSGFTHGPLPLLFNQGAVLVGLIHSYLPFMILPIYAALERTDDRLIEAARDLGANPVVTFRRVILPQTTRAAGVGCMLVFTASLGAFVTPDLLGGPTSLMVASVIESQVLQVRDWNFAAALAVLLLLVVGLCALAYRALVRATREQPA